MKARATYCWLCLGALDQRLRWPSPWCTTVHHVVPLARGGDPTDLANLVAAHRTCNEKVGARIVREGALAEVQPDRLNASRAW